ncbi:MAG: radical SAM protein [Candidatus Portnoybacteria bacterium]|nr:radical SAM protein [Candidatus Portnoybacteria bacterium]
MKRIPIRGSIELTGKCNLNCIHCYAKGERKNKDISFRELKKIFDQIIKEGCLFLQLTGGECLLRKDFDLIYSYIRKKGLIPTIMTNATLINDKLIQTLKKYPPYHIMISLYGSNSLYHDKITKTNGSFNKTLQNIFKLKKAGIKIWITSVIMKENFSNFSSIKKLEKKD